MMLDVAANDVAAFAASAAAAAIEFRRVKLVL